MTIQECINSSLLLLNQYSIGGTVIPLSYNDQADDVARMIVLINDAMMEIATTVRPIIDSVEFVVPKVDVNDPMEDFSFSMPTNCNHPTKIYFTPEEGRDRRVVDVSKGVRFIDDGETLLIQNRPAGTYKVEYERYPAQFNLETNKNTRLDNTPDTHVIIPYYVAAMIALDDNAKAYYALYNVWETRLSRLDMKPARAVFNDVADVYGF